MASWKLAPCLRLDLSENLLDAELGSVVQGVTRMKSLLSLNISKNLPKIKAKEVAHVMEAIVQLIQVKQDQAALSLFAAKILIFGIVLRYRTKYRIIPFLVTNAIDYVILEGAMAIM